ncbi:GNAT family N-acetyltransferase, partial [PVC group bacterium]|nr:GNAT family N-acetyltransferase [PVC group bacterium]
SPTGIKARIEDIVVQPSHLRKGIARKLIGLAIHESGRKGAASLDLTSSPTRQEANKLYRKLGFSKRKTNVHRYELSKV